MTPRAMSLAGANGYGNKFRRHGSHTDADETKDCRDELSPCW